MECGTNSRGINKTKDSLKSYGLQYATRNRIYWTSMKYIPAIVGWLKTLRQLDIFAQFGSRIAFMLIRVIRFIPLTIIENQKIMEAQQVWGWGIH